MSETQRNHIKINNNKHIERINVKIYGSFVTYSTTIKYNRLGFFFLFRLIQSNTHVHINLSFLLEQVCYVVIS